MDIAPLGTGQPTSEYTTGEYNWAGNLGYRQERLERPTEVRALQEIVAAASSVRALGSRHSFSDIADTTGTLVSLENLPSTISVDGAGRTVSVGAATRYGELAAELQRQGFAIANLASLPHISVAGAVATATHGSGNGNGNLATAVAAIEFVTASGALRTVLRGEDPDFEGMVVNLGALGIMTRLTLDIEPSFTVRQDAYTGLPWDRVLGNFEEITGAAYSVSLFTDWAGDTVSQAWLKSQTSADDDGPAASDFFGGTRAEEPLHPVPGMSPVNCTQQLGVPGPWSDRLAHFRLAFTPSSGAELQSEYLVGSEHALAAIDAVRSLAPKLAPLLQISEIRTMAADRLWLSSNYGRSGIGLHFTWKPLQAEVEAFLPELESSLAPFAARPHWGKLFTRQAGPLERLYPRLGDFRALADAWDPKGKFRNGFLERTVFAPAASPAS
ncbi:FAD-binding protein [Arthrobacter frigidicola]|nr:FAD-binding protein [Arthrobacter frigidicola]